MCMNYFLPWASDQQSDWRIWTFCSHYSRSRLTGDGLLNNKSAVFVFVRADCRDTKSLHVMISSKSLDQKHKSKLNLWSINWKFTVHEVTCNVSRRRFRRLDSCSVWLVEFGSVNLYFICCDKQKLLTIRWRAVKYTDREYNPSAGFYPDTIIHSQVPSLCLTAIWAFELPTPHYSKYCKRIRTKDWTSRTIPHGPSWEHSW